MSLPFYHIRLHIENEDTLLLTHIVPRLFDSIPEAMVAAEVEAVACVDSQYKMRSRSSKWNHGMWVFEFVDQNDDEIEIIIKAEVVEVMEIEEVSEVDGRGMGDEIDFSRERLKYKNA
jgi:hypothetical protein